MLLLEGEEGARLLLQLGTRGLQLLRQDRLRGTRGEVRKMMIDRKRGWGGYERLNGLTVYPFLCPFLGCVVVVSYQLCLDLDLGVCELRECRLVVPEQRPRLLTLRLRTKHTRLSGQSHNIHIV